MVDEMGGVDEVDDPAGAVHFRFLGASFGDSCNVSYMFLR
jgi:hypothetical protein